MLHMKVILLIFMVKAGIVAIRLKS